MFRCNINIELHHLLQANTNKHYKILMLNIIKKILSLFTDDSWPHDTTVADINLTQALLVVLIYDSYKY